MSRPMRIVMIEDDAFEIQRFTAYFDTLNDMELVSSAKGEEEGLKAVASNSPDAIILDLELAEGNGIQFLPKLRTLSLEVQPYIIVTTWTTDQITLRNVKANGVGFVQPKSMPGYGEHGPRMVANFLREMRPFFPNQDRSLIQKSAQLPDEDTITRAKIIQALGRIGITTGTLSQLYLVESILIASRLNGMLVDMDNTIYPELTRQYHVTRASLERAMRARIESAWSRTDLETLRAEYTQYVNPKKGKPELKEFIGFYASKFK